MPITDLTIFSEITLLEICCNSNSTAASIKMSNSLHAADELIHSISEAVAIIVPKSIDGTMSIFRKLSIALVVISKSLQCLAYCRN